MKRLVAVVLAAFMLFAGSVRSDEVGAVEKAKAAAATWLSVTDSQRYERSWEGAAQLFQHAVDKQEWTAQLERVRVPLGGVKSRAFKAAELARLLPNAPEGQYVVLQFESVFEKSPQMIETVTVMLEEDGSWKVSGYYIEPRK